MKDILTEDVKKTYASWRKETRSDDVTISINVEEAENGFVIRVSKYGSFGKNKSYKDISKTFISKTNPLSDKDLKEESDDILDNLKSLF
jgi:hypothetical protein